MQLRKTVWMLTALSALSLAMTACDGEGTDETSCASDTECATGEACHPSAKVCVATCTSGSDCPAEEKTCAPFGTNGPSVCQCATDQICAQNAGDGYICSNLDKRCVEKCTADADCGSGRTCNEGTGQCEQGSTGPTCTYGTCTGGQVCSATSGKCEAAPSCTGTAQGTCAYGQYCSGSACADAPAPTCGNLQGKAAANFSAATGTGNIIYNVEKRKFATDAAGCPGSTNPVNVIPRISFYVKTGEVPATEESFSGFFYVRTDKGEVPLNADNLLNYTRSADRKSATVDVYLCIPEASQVTMGFYFTNGNGYCATFTR